MSTASVLLPCPGVTPRVLHAGGLGKRIWGGQHRGHRASPSPEQFSRWSQARRRFSWECGVRRSGTGSEL